MNKFKYYEAPSLFLAPARGLFSVKEPAREPGDESCYRIIARGYDKFFNIGESANPPICVTLVMRVYGTVL